jgi:tetratricopeptide (TPR) repeat protein
MQEDLGKAYFGMGEYKKSKEVYEAALELDSRNAEIRRLHLEASQKYLETLEETNDTGEIAQVQGGMVSDKAMLLALNADEERKAIEKVKTQLDRADPQSPEEALALLERVRLLGQSYSALGGADFADPADREFVRGELGILAGEVFGVMAAAAQESPYTEINRLFPLYHGLGYLARGDDKNARERLSVIRSEFPEADGILKTMERDDLRSLNLAALDVWESTVEGHEEYEEQKELIDGLRASIRRGDAASIKEALAESDDPYEQDLLARTGSGDTGGSEILPHLIEYASTIDASEDMIEILFNDAQRTEDLVPQGSYGVYCLLEASSSQEKFKNWSKDAKAELTREKSFLEKFGKTVLSLLPTNPEELALTMMGIGLAQKLGSMARLATLSKLAEAGIEGKLALRLALGAEILAEGNALFAFNTVQTAAYQPAEALSPEHLAMNYGATLLTLGFLKPAVAAGKSYGPKFARALGLVEGADLSKAGERFVWATVHTFGLGSLVASGQVNQLLNLAETPPGGFAESLAGDFVFYVKYGFAGKLFEHAVGGKTAPKTRSLHEEAGIIPIAGETAEADVLARQSAARTPANPRIAPDDLLAQSGPWNVLGLPIGQSYANGVPQGAPETPAPSVPAMMMEVRAFVSTAKAEQWGGNAADYYRADLATVASNLRGLETDLPGTLRPKNLLRRLQERPKSSEGPTSIGRPSACC